MDKRTIFAFVLIGLIIILYPHYMEWIMGPEIPIPPSEPFPAENRRTPPLSPPDRSARTPEIVPEPPRAATTGQADIPVAPAEFTPRDVIVETDLFTATFSTRGGVLTRLVLRAYEHPDGGQLDLLAPGSTALGLSLAGEPLDAYEFSTDAPGLTLAGAEQAELIFRSRTGTRTIEKRIRFQGNRYRADVAVAVSGLQPQDKLGVGWSGSLADTENNPEENAVYTSVVTRAGGEVETWDVADLGPDGDPPPGGRISWVGIRNKYFLVALIPPEGSYGLNMAGDMRDINERYDVEIISKDVDPARRFGVYFGPISYDRLRQQNRDLSGNYRELEMEEFMEYGFAIFRPIIKPITNLNLRAFLALHPLIPNYGLVIIVFSVLIKIVVFPLTHKSLEAAARMQQLQPRIAAMREKYPDDQQKVSREMMKLYKEEGVNPLGGCLPMVIQMPILFSLFNVFRGAIELRQSEFVFWITDLSQPDRLYIGGFEIHLLPLLMAVSTFVQSKMTMKDPKQAFMVYIMPVFMTWIFWSMSSGLVLYWTMFNVLTILQQQVMERVKRVLGTR
ncbi:MAG: membrane protein insertase YidC [Gemmatimonadota bacterium]|nr:membrane protein insertase YidC [Gemmatimonadota bacterium]